MSREQQRDQAKKLDPSQSYTQGQTVTRTENSGLGFHVCLNGSAAGSAVPPPFQSNDQWHWVSL